MTFFSILYMHSQDEIDEENIQEPDFFSDLNLNKVVLAITNGNEDYNLRPFFYDSLKSLDAITYRHEIFRDLENPHIYNAIVKFSATMKQMRNELAQADKLYYNYQKESWFLDAVELYCRSVRDLARELNDIKPQSCGLSHFLRYLNQYIPSEQFIALEEEISQLKSDLSKVRYCLYIKGKEITVQAYNDEADFLFEVIKTCELFTGGTCQPYYENSPDYPEMNHIEAKILDFVAKIFPNEFARFEAFYTKNLGFFDNIIRRFDREIHFYISYLEFIARFKKEGLSFCIPYVSNTKDISNIDGFDLALAHQLIEEKRSIVCNDFYMAENERIFVITGPNQGGKTTFARAFGQIHYLASLGLMVPGRRAKLFLFDNLFTHFEREEDMSNLMSKLEDDLVRIHDIFQHCTSRSIIIINEMFTSTTVQDALFLGRNVLEYALKLDVICLYVTFLDELTHIDKTVSLVSTVDPLNPDLRTYKIERKPADGLSYAIALAKKNHVTFEEITQRIQS